MKIYLKIPYWKNDTAKKAGLRFDGLSKMWFYEDGDSVNLTLIHQLKYGNKSIEQLKQEAMDRYRNKNG